MVNHKLLSGKFTAVKKEPARKCKSVIKGIIL